MFRGWVTAAGGTVTGDGLLAISPLVSYGGEGLAALAGTTIATPASIKKRTDGGSGLIEGPPAADGTAVYLL